MFDNFYHLEQEFKRLKLSLKLQRGSKPTNCRVYNEEGEAVYLNTASLLGILKTYESLDDQAFWDEAIFRT